MTIRIGRRATSAPAFEQVDDASAEQVRTEVAVPLRPRLQVASPVQKRDGITGPRPKLLSAQDVPLDVAALGRGSARPAMSASDVLKLQYGGAQSMMMAESSAPDDAEIDDGNIDDGGDGGGGGGGIGDGGGGGGGIGDGGDGGGGIGDGGDGGGGIGDGGDGGGGIGDGGDSGGTGDSGAVIGDDGVDDGSGTGGTEEGASVDNDAAADYLDAHATDSYDKKKNGHCATAVREALEEGGLDTTNHPRDAKDWGDFLETKGYTEELEGTTPDNGSTVPDDYVPEKGDIIVLQPVDGQTNPAGHIAMFDGTRWVSDFKQNTMWGGYQGKDATYKIYRP